MARSSVTARNSKRRRQPRRRLAMQLLTSRRLMAADLAIAQPHVETVLADSFEFAWVEPIASSQDVNANDVAIQQIAGDSVASPDYFYDVLSRQVRTEVSEDTGLSGVSRYEYDGLSNLPADPLQDIKDLYDSRNNDPNNGQANSADDAVGVNDDASSELPYQYDSNRNVVRPTPGNDPYDDIVIRYPYDSDSIGEVYTFYAPGETNADNDENANEPLLGPGRGGLLGPGGVVDQNGQAANADNDNEENANDNEPLLGPGRGGLLGPGGVVDQNGQAANADNDNEQNANDNEPLLGPGRGGLLGPGGVVDQNGREANADNDNEQNANDNEPLLGPGRGGLLGPGGVVDQNGQAANADNDNEENANDNEPLLGPGRGGLLGPGGVVDQNGREANRDQGRSDRFDGNEGPALRRDANDDELDALAARFQQLLKNAFGGEQSDLASFGDPNALALGYFHGRLLPALPFAGLFSGGTTQSPWIRQQRTPSQESLPEVLRNNPLTAALLRYKLGDYGLEDLSQADFDAYTRGLQRGYRDALESIFPESSMPGF